MSTPDDYDDGYGPPTMEDDAWYTHAVVSQGYPRVRRDPKPAEGQMSITDVLPTQTLSSIHIDKPGFWEVGVSGDMSRVRFPASGWYSYEDGGWRYLGAEEPK